MVVLFWDEPSDPEEIEAALSKIRGARSCVNDIGMKNAQKPAVYVSGAMAFCALGIFSPEAHKVPPRGRGVEGVAVALTVIRSVSKLDDCVAVNAV
jgi:hypothetical protein